jgi:hypothetical protein
MIPTARVIHTRPPTGTPRRATCPGEGLPISYAFLGGSGRGCPQRRASNEHSFTVRVLRARRAPGRSLLILLKPRVARARGSSQPPRPLFKHPTNCLPAPSGTRQSSRELHTLSTGAFATCGSFFFLLRRLSCSVLRSASFYRNQRGCLLFTQTQFHNCTST